PGRPSTRPRQRSTTTSVPSTILTAGTRPSVTSVRWTMNGNTLPVRQHSGTVYGIGSTPERDQAAMKLKAVEVREAKVRQRAIAEAEARVRAEADKKLKAAVAEHEQAAAAKLKVVEAREAKARQEAAAEAQAMVKAEVDKKLKAAASERDQVSAKLKAVEKQA